MKWRLGLVDICALILLALLWAMPSERVRFSGAYKSGPGDLQRDVPKELELANRYQAELYQNPGNGEAAYQLAGVMSRLGRHDMSVRIAGAAAQIPSPSNWRALIAASHAYGDRIDVPAALQWATESLASCHQPSADCPDHEEVRVRLYVEQLAVGAKVIHEGIDPKSDPDAFRLELSKTHPRMRSGTAK